MTKKLSLLATITLACLALSCSDSPAPAPTPAPTPVPAPTPTPTPAPTPSPPPSGSTGFANLQGNWSGTLESPSFTTKTIAVLFDQEGDELDGSWYTPTAQSRWVGWIGGFLLLGGGLNAEMTFEFDSGDQRCSGRGDLRGTASDTEATYTWTLTRYDTEKCASATVPSEMTMRVQR